DHPLDIRAGARAGGGGKHFVEREAPNAGARKDDRMTDTTIVKTGTLPADEPELRLKRQPGYHDLMALAQTLLQTGFLPQAIRTPGQALAIILTGQEMKLGPMQSLRSIGIINGKPVLAADLQLA